jgi:hypothetical protein
MIAPPRRNGDWIIFPGVIVAEHDFDGWTVQTYARKLIVPMASIHGPTVRLNGWKECWFPEIPPSLIGREVEVVVSKFADDNRENRYMCEPNVLE